MTCPKWARKACFKSQSEEWQSGEKHVVGTIRGCSSFARDDNKASCNGFRMNNDQIEGMLILSVLDN